MGQFNMGGFSDNRKGRRGESDSEEDSSFSFGGFSFFNFGDFSGGEMPDFDPENMPEGGFSFGGGNMPDMSGFGSGSMGNTYGSSKLTTLIVYGACLAFMLILLMATKPIRRRR